LFIAQPRWLAPRGASAHRGDKIGRRSGPSPGSPTGSKALAAGQPPWMEHRRISDPGLPIQPPGFQILKIGQQRPQLRRVSFDRASNARLAHDDHSPSSLADRLGRHKYAMRQATVALGPLAGRGRERVRNTPAGLLAAVRRRPATRATFAITATQARTMKARSPSDRQVGATGPMWAAMRPGHGRGSGLTASGTSPLSMVSTIVNDRPGGLSRNIASRTALGNYLNQRGLSPDSRQGSGLGLCVRAGDRRGKSRCSRGCLLSGVNPTWVVHRVRTRPLAHHTTTCRCFSLRKPAL
jgi:hypothetical protein